MIKQAGIKQADVSTRPHGDSIKLLAAAFAVVGLIMCLVFASESLHIDLSRQEVDSYLWVIGASAVAFYMLLRVVLGRTRINHLLDRIVEKVVTPFVRTK
jgi:hypothetical protein